MSLSIIVAVAENGVIGRGGDLPWRLSADLRRFKRLTMGHTLIMGRKTWDSIGRPLPGRTSVVISRQAGFRTEFGEVRVATNLEDALAQIGQAGEAFVIGGASIYALALPQAEKLFVTRVHAEVAGDTYFPKVSWDEWQLVEEARYESNGRNDHAYSFQVYHRK
ncbi:MAG: dihydrofolate reductase [Pirellulales bacterium]|nr:dihydrofolate reductase [Pirellulales bacterium]